MSSRFINRFRHWQQQSEQKIWMFETFFGTSVFFLFLGFICGNLFGTFLNFFRNYLFWDGFIILLTILMVEWISYAHRTYFGSRKPLSMNHLNQIKPSRLIDVQSVSMPVFKSDIQEFNLRHRFLPLLYRFLNFYKMGLLLGFFTDAFKVGS
jgi:Protein of unknown function (DUF565)